MTDQNPYPQQPAPSAEKAEKNRKTDKKLLKILGAVIGVFVVIIILVAACSPDNDDSTTDTGSGVGKWDAQTQCEAAAKERSSDPNNVKFSGATDTAFVEIKDGWQVVGWVDNPNGLGGYTHHEYTCSVESTDQEGKVNVGLDISEAK
ncbi:hypothetical protein [Corynebacterium provencense]|uniref:hypothetical protein n=1 Tax=Corynebacterium provencense TaxID=1737425 RepID=UPI00082D25CC|nr:hypothetical protein [Corynebacterium provencense]